MMAGGAYIVFVLSLIPQTVIVATTTSNPIFQNFEDGMKAQEKFLKADLKLLRTTITSKIFDLLSNRVLSLKNNISEDYNKSLPTNTTGYNLQCLQEVNYTVDLDSEIDYSQLTFSGCANLTQSYGEALLLIKNTTALNEELDNLTNIIITQVELVCQNKTGYTLLKCLGENVTNFKEMYNELYQRILTENKIVNGELLLWSSEEKKCLEGIFNEVHLFITDLSSQFEKCKN